MHLAKGSTHRFEGVALYAVAALLLAPGCALRSSMSSVSHEAAFGLGGAGRLGDDSQDDLQYRIGGAMVWKAAYALCLDDEGEGVCLEVPVDSTPVSTVTSPVPTAPRHFSTLSFTPGLRLETDELPGGLLPLNFIAVGLGAARYVTSGTRLDGTTVERRRGTTVLIRIETGLNLRLRKRLGLRLGVFGEAGELPSWFREVGVVPAGGSLDAERIGGFGVVYFRP